MFVAISMFLSVVDGLARSNYVRVFWGSGDTALAMSHAIPSDVFHGLKCDRWNSADSAVVWGWAGWELHAELGELPVSWLSLLFGVHYMRRCAA